MVNEESASHGWYAKCLAKSGLEDIWKPVDKAPKFDDFGRDIQDLYNALIIASNRINNVITNDERSIAGVYVFTPGLYPEGTLNSEQLGQLEGSVNEGVHDTNYPADIKYANDDVYNGCIKSISINFGEIEAIRVDVMPNGDIKILGSELGSWAFDAFYAQLFEDRIDYREDYGQLPEDRIDARTE